MRELLLFFYLDSCSLSHHFLLCGMRRMVHTCFFFRFLLKFLKICYLDTRYYLFRINVSPAGRLVEGKSYFSSAQMLEARRDVFVAPSVTPIVNLRQL